MATIPFFRCLKILGEPGKQEILQQNVRKILDLKSEQIVSENWRWVPLISAPFYFFTFFIQSYLKLHGKKRSWNKDLRSQLQINWIAIRKTCISYTHCSTYSSKTFLIWSIWSLLKISWTIVKPSFSYYIHGVKER